MGKGGKGKDKGKGKGKGKWEPEGPPDAIEEIGSVSHECEDELVCKCTNERVPHFNARVFLDNKEQVGKIDEIFGPINSFYFTVKMEEGMKASSFKKGKTFYVDNMKLLPMARFLPAPSISKAGKGKGDGKGKGKKGKDKGKGKGKGKGISSGLGHLGGREGGSELGEELILTHEVVGVGGDGGNGGGGEEFHR